MERAERIEESQDEARTAPAGGVPDVRALIEEIRRRVKEDVAGNRERRAFIPTVANGNVQRAGDVVHSEELNFINVNWKFGGLDIDKIQSHRPGIAGRIIVKVKRWIINTLWDAGLKEYFKSERDYMANLVRLINNLTQYVDARDGANFWELIRKIDVDVTRATERIERIADEQHATLRSAERSLQEGFYSELRAVSDRLGKLEAGAAQADHQLKVLDSVARGMEGILARVPVTSELARAESSAAQLAGTYSYLLLENRFRGSEKEISDRLAHYADKFRGAEKPVLEIGGGRGELQALFRAAGIASYSVDMDAAMVEASKAGGFDARSGDGIAHLRSLEPASLGGVVAIQVVEHLTREQLEQLMKAAVRAVVPGGKIVFETINPQSMLALSSNYFRDPTHVFPMHPDTLRYMMDLSGMKDVSVEYLSPVPAEAQLRELPVDEAMPPRWAYTVRLLNHNLRRLNELIFGCQDFCIVGSIR